MKMPEVTKYYVARNKKGGVYMFNKKPVKSKHGFWKIDGTPASDNLMIRLDGSLCISEFGDVIPHWEDDEPKLVALALVPYEAIDQETITEIKFLTR